MKVGKKKERKIQANPRNRKSGQREDEIEEKVVRSKVAEEEEACN